MKWAVTQSAPLQIYFTFLPPLLAEDRRSGTFAKLGWRSNSMSNLNTLGQPLSKSSIIIICYTPHAARATGHSSHSHRNWLELSEKNHIGTDRTQNLRSGTMWQRRPLFNRQNSYPGLNRKYLNRTVVFLGEGGHCTSGIREMAPENLKKTEHIFRRRCYRGPWLMQYRYYNFDMNFGREMHHF